MREVPSWLAVVTLVGLLALGVFAIAAGRTVDIEFWPPAIHAKAPAITSETPEASIPSRRDDWTYEPFKNASEAAVWLSLKKPNPRDVYATIWGPIYHCLV